LFRVIHYRAAIGSRGWYRDCPASRPLDERRGNYATKVPIPQRKIDTWGAKPMIYEMRRLPAVFGRGRLAALFEHASSRTDAEGFGESTASGRRGFFFTSGSGEIQSGTGTYFSGVGIARPERETKWNAFATDPDWLTARAKGRGSRPDRRQHRQSKCVPNPPSDE